MSCKNLTEKYYFQQGWYSLSLIKGADHHSVVNHRIFCYRNKKEKDLFTPLSVAGIIHENVKHSDLFVLPDGTHYAMTEYPAEITTEIVKFMGKHRMDGRIPAADDKRPVKVAVVESIPDNTSVQQPS